MLQILIISICIFSAIHFIWIIWQWMIIRQLSNRRGSLKGDYPSISIVIAARNEIQNLKRLLPRLKGLDYPGDWEVIIVSDGSEDGTMEFLLRQSEFFNRLIPIEQTETERAKSKAPKKLALRKAINNSNFDFILQTDADCIPLSNGWIKKMSSGIKTDNSIVLGLSFYKTSPSIINAISRYDALITAINMLSLTLAKKPFMALGRNWLFSKKLFLEKGAYDDQMDLNFGDDDLLFQELRSDAEIEIIVAKESQTISQSEKTLGDYIKQKTRHQMAGKYYPLKDRLRLIISYFPILIWVLLIVSMFYSSLGWGILLLRGILTTIVYRATSKYLNSKFNFGGLVFYELIHSLVSLLTSTKAIASKTIRWK